MLASLKAPFGWVDIKVYGHCHTFEPVSWLPCVLLLKITGVIQKCKPLNIPPTHFLPSAGMGLSSETKLHSLPAALKFITHLPLLQECWGYRCIPAGKASFSVC